MSQRDELAEILHQEATADRVKNAPLRNVPVVAAKVEATVDAILAAGYSKPRTITTVDGLKALYEGDVIRDAEGLIWQVDGSTARWINIEEGDGDTYNDEDVTLPATVLYEPETHHAD